MKRNARVQTYGIALGVAIFASATAVYGGPDNLNIEYAAPPLRNGELNELRGGFMLGNGLIVNFGLEFRTTVDNQPVTVISLTEADLMQGRGIIQRVSDDPTAASGNQFTADAGSHRVTVDVTDRISGWMTIVQNNASGVSIQNDTQLNIQIANVQTVAQRHNSASRMVLPVTLIR